MRTLVTISIFCLFAATAAQGQTKTAARRITVDASGKGDYRSIQAAINSLPDSPATASIIYIRDGIYNEKLYIEKHHIILQGQSREKTIVTQSIARDAWRCQHNDDWGVATININGNDITLQNLTVINTFGFDFTEERTIPCAADSSTGFRMIKKNSHQMALRTMNGTRLRAINCHFKAFGGDTVSPWNAENGMFYFRDCIMEGGVDFYCPRGWAWAENCRFISHSGTAAIWHDGSRNPDAKTVLKNCFFDGFKGFNLGRYHRDAQFYLIGCSFSENMADKDIFLVPTGNTILWGRRVYYFNSHRQGGNYAWHQDNLHTAPGAPAAKDITVDWLFDGRWKPHAVNTTVFTPTAHVRLKKMESGGYGVNLNKEVMPAAHPANDFSKQALPYYQAEGPAWENDKVAFRLYFDVRNGKDIFGKTTASMVMDTVGTWGDRFYHQFDWRWGMDVLKVGGSLGAGALALQVRMPTGADTVVRLGGSGVGQVVYEVIKDGMKEAAFRLTYKDWKVFDRLYQLTEEISIKEGDYYYTSKVSISGLRGDERLVTGVVNLRSSQMHSLSLAHADVIYTHDRQSENDDYLGMAIMTLKGTTAYYGTMPKEGSGVTNTYTVAFNTKNNQPVTFRFYACWEKTDARFRDRDYFAAYLQKEAASWRGTDKNTKQSNAKKL